MSIYRPLSRGVYRALGRGRRSGIPTQNLLFYSKDGSTDTIGLSVSQYLLVDESVRSIFFIDAETLRPIAEAVALAKVSSLLNQGTMLGIGDTILLYEVGTAQAVLDKALKYLRLGGYLSISKLLSTLNTPQTDHHFYRYKNRAYYFLRGLGDGTYWAVDLVEEDSYGYVAQQIKNAHICIPYQSIAQGDPSITRYESGSWQWEWFSNINAYGGEYYKNSTAGDYWEYTTPAGVTMVGHRAYHASNAGIALVEIDGDATLADMLPTAQDLVDSGALVNTALITNGGTLNPADRVLDMSVNYDDDFTNGVTLPLQDNRVVFTKSLPAAAHTVRLTCTGYKNTASTDVRLYACAVIYGGEDVVTPATANITTAVGGNPGGFYSISRVGGDSVWEYAIKPHPTGTTDVDYIGNGHGYESQVGDVSLSVDGVSIAIPAEDAIVSGAIIVAERTTEMFHPEVDAGLTPIADIVVEYSLESLGIKISSSVTWLVNGTQDGGYWHMYPFSNWATMGGNIGDLPGSPVTLGYDDGRNMVQAESNLTYVWNNSQPYVGVLYSPTPANASGPVTLNDVITGNICMIQDRTGGLINKIYLTRAGWDDVAPFSISDIWEFSALYQFAPLANAHAVLTSL